VTPSIFRSLGQPETCFADEKVVTQQNAQKDGLFWLVWKIYFDLVRSTKIEAPLIGLWPKSFSVTVTRTLGLRVYGLRFRSRIYGLGIWVRAIRVQGLRSEF